jgi:hypothetical protein
MASLTRTLSALFLSSAWLAAASSVAAQDTQSSPPVITDVPPPPSDSSPASIDTEAAPATGETPGSAAEEPTAPQPARARARQAPSPAVSAAPAREEAAASPQPAGNPENTIAAPPSTVVPAQSVATYNPQVTPPAVLPDPGEYRMMRILPWILGGILALGVLAFLYLRKDRRRSEADDYEDEPASPAMPRTAPRAAEPLLPPEPKPEPGAATAPSVLVRRVGSRGVAGMSMGMTAAAATTRPRQAAPGGLSGSASIDMRIKPLRAGISESDAVVEFELTVTNKGQISAEDVRISTWMFPAGTAMGSEMERSLIRPPAQVILSEVDPGDPKRVEASVSLPVERLKTDSVLPVVVAEARYRLADGREESSVVRFAVGVPVAGELAHFDVNNPTGLHDGVEARPLNG